MLYKSNNLQKMIWCDLSGHNNQYSAFAVHLEGKLYLSYTKPMNTHNLNHKKLEIKQKKLTE
jgi:hypothetical protein